MNPVREYIETGWEWVKHITRELLQAIKDAIWPD